MEIPVNYRSEYLKCFGYTKHIDDSDELCLICMTDETEDGHQWERYQLQCGHIFHTRCLRRWCYVKKHLNCSYCGIYQRTRRQRIATFIMCLAYISVVIPADVREFVPYNPADNRSVLVVFPLYSQPLAVVRCIS